MDNGKLWPNPGIPLAAPHENIFHTPLDTHEPRVYTRIMYCTFTTEAAMMMTYETAMAIGRDAANAQMRQAGRTVWNREDRNTAAAAFNAAYPVELDAPSTHVLVVAQGVVVTDVLSKKRQEWLDCSYFPHNWPAPADPTRTVYHVYDYNHVVWCTSCATWSGAFGKKPIRCVICDADLMERGNRGD